jgi:DNA-binding MarR family transcriptional regulator
MSPEPQLAIRSSAGEATSEAALTDLALPSLLRAGSGRIQGLLERAFADVELSSTQFELLLLVRRNPTVSQGELARTLSVNRATLVRWVEELVCAGLMRRVVQLADRRFKRLQLTPKGRRRLAVLELRFETALRPMKLQLGAADYAQLMSLLSRLEGTPRPPVWLRLAEAERAETDLDEA